MFKFIKSNTFKKGSLFLTVFAAALSATLLINKGLESSDTPRANNQNNLDDLPMTPGERLINSVLDYEAVQIDATLELRLEDYTELDFNINGQAQFKDLEDIKLLADLDANFNGVPVTGELGYFDNELSFALEDICYFKLKTSELLELYA